MKKILLVSLVAIFLVACSDNSPKLDFSSQEKFTESAKKIVDTLPKDQQEIFNQAFVEMSLNAVQQSNGDSEQVWEIMKKNLDGKKVSDIIYEYKSARSPQIQPVQPVDGNSEMMPEQNPNTNVSTETGTKIE